MAPIWSSYIEPGKTQVLYIIDSSAPEHIGAATIHLLELMAEPSLQSAPFLLVFTKSDMESPRWSRQVVLDLVLLFDSLAIRSILLRSQVILRNLLQKAR